MNIYLGPTNNRDIQRAKKLYRAWLERLGLTQLVYDATRSTNKTQNILDHVITTDKIIFGEPRVYSHSDSDHDMKGFVRHKTKVARERKRITIRSHRDFTPGNFALQSEQLILETALLEPDPDLAWEKFKTIYISFLDKVVPWVETDVREDSVPWGDGEWYTLSREKNKSNHTFNVNPTDQNWVSFKRIRNNNNMRKQELKRNLMMTNIDKFKHDPKKLWATLKRLLPNSKIVQHLKKLEGESDPSKIAEIMDEYFANIGPELANVFGGNSLI